MHKKMLRILVDMDGVLADFEHGFLQKWKAKYPAEPYIEYNDRKSFYVDEDYPEHLREKAEKLTHEQNFFRELPPIPGGKDALCEMTEYGHDVWICTAPLSAFENCVAEKFHWVEANLGREWTRRIIMLKDKTLVNGDVLIDDRPLIAGVAKPSFIHVVFTAPYNTSSTSLRMDSWDMWYNVLGNL